MTGGVRRISAVAIAVIVAVAVSGASAPLSVRTQAPGALTKNRSAAPDLAPPQRPAADLLSAGPIARTSASAGSISGFVTDGTNGIWGIWVRVYDTSGRFVASADYLSYYDGDYQVSGLAPGDYLVEFDPKLNRQFPWSPDYHYMMEWYSGSPTPDGASLVTVRAGQDTPNIDASLDSGGGAIGGSARDTAGGRAAGVNVWLWQRLGAGWMPCLYATTNDSGEYCFVDLPPGDYRVSCWNAKHNTEWVYPGVPIPDLGDDIAVSAGVQETADLVSPGSEAVVDWTVRAAGSPLADAVVQPYFRTPHDGWLPVPDFAVSTDVLGAAAMTGMLPGDYKFGFARPGYTTAYYHDAADLSVATTVTVGPAPAGGSSANLTQTMVRNGGDAVAPVTTIVGAPAARTWVGADPTVSFTATDGTGGSGVTATRWAWEGSFQLGVGTPLRSGNVWDGGPLTFTAVVPGQAAKSGIWYWSVDGNGNAEAPREATLWVDKKAPVTTSDRLASGNYSESARITLDAKDPDSGVAYTHYTLDGGGEQSGTTVMTSVPGPHTLLYWSVDAAGNVEVPQSIGFNVGPHAPYARIVQPAFPPVVKRHENIHFEGAFSDVSTHTAQWWLWTDNGRELSLSKEFDCNTLTVGDHTIALQVVCAEVGAFSDPVSFQLSVAPGYGTSVYRFYNRQTGTHFYTADFAERDKVMRMPSYSFDGWAYFVNQDSAENDTPLYRFYNKKKGTHFYTADPREKDRLVATMGATYQLDGVAYYVASTPCQFSTTVWRFYNFRTGTHFYTADPAEKANVENNMRTTYSLDGPAFFLAP